MFNILASESIKLFSLRSTWIYLALCAGAMFGAAALASLAVGEGNPMDLGYLFVGGDLSLIVVVFAAAMMAATDFTKGTAAWSYLTTNNRLGLVAVQLPLIALSVTLAATLGVGLAVPFIVITGTEIDFTLTETATTTLISYHAQWLVFAALAVLIAVILRSGAFAAMILIADFFVVEAMLRYAGIDAIKPVLDLLPLANIRVLANGEYADVAHGPVAAGMILAVTIALIFAIAGWVVRRRAVR